jgi:hypothetical protein
MVALNKKMELLLPVLLARSVLLAQLQCLVLPLLARLAQLALHVQLQSLAYLLQAQLVHWVKQFQLL